MKHWAITITTSLVALIIGFAVGGAYIGMAYKTPQPAEVVHEKPKTLPLTKLNLLALVNLERAKVDVQPLKEDRRLDWSAQQKADDMAKYDYFAHESSLSPNDSGKSHQWLVASGVQCTSTSENITVSRTDSTDAIQSWVGSKSHYAAMINSKYVSTGFGFQYAEHIPKSNFGPKIHGNSKDINNSYVIVEHFCQPA